MELHLSGSYGSFKLGNIVMWLSWKTHIKEYAYLNLCSVAKHLFGGINR